MSEAVLDTTEVRRWKAYGNYSTVATETVCKLPNHWSLTRLKHATAINSEVLNDTTEPDYEIQYLDISNVDSLGNINEIQTMPFASAPSRARRIVRDGDVIVSTVRTYLKAIAAISNPPDNLIVSTGFAVLRPRLDVYPPFLARLVQAKEFVDMVVNHSEGVGYPAINPTDLSALPIWLPPLSEQRAIAAFLDRETARIDALVAKKQRLIELLEEKRQAVISNAVLRGINPKVERKDSEREWLGSIPHHWQTLRIADFADKITNGFVGPTRDILVPDGVRYLQSLHIKDGYVLFERGPYYVAEEWSNAHSKSILQCGDVVIVQTGAEVGQSAVIKEDFAGVNCHALIIVSSNKEKYYGEYLGRVLRSTYGRQALKVVETGAMHPHLNCNKVREIVVPQPPLDEQREIVRHIEEQEGRFSRVLDSIEVGVQRLAEYRSALISAAVTGQIDVRDEVQLDE